MVVVVVVVGWWWLGGGGWVVVGLVVVEARHGEGPGEGLHPLPEGCDASHRLRVLQQEALEVLQLSWRTEIESAQRKYCLAPCLHLFSVCCL